MPLPNSLVELGWSSPGIPFGNAGRLIATGRTSANGFVSFSFKAFPRELKGGKFYVSFPENKDYFPQQRGYYGIYRYDSVVNANLHVPSKAILKITYKNFMPASEADYFRCTPGILTYGSSGIPLRMHQPNGQLSNTEFLGSEAPFSVLELTGTTAGNQYTYFEIIKKRNGARVDSRDSIYIPKGGTGTYEIDF